MTQVCTTFTLVTDGIEADRLTLEPSRVVDFPETTHVRYRVIR